MSRRVLVLLILAIFLFFIARVMANIYNFMSISGTGGIEIIIPSSELVFEVAEPNLVRR